MSKALITFAVGPHEQFLDVALPSFHTFADRHGYELVIPEPIDCTRPPSWWKIPALVAALEQYDEALFLDADMVVIDPSEDLGVDGWAWQAMVEHHTGDGDVPNCAVWLVRRPMLPFLHIAWSLEKYLNHGWWEQAAMHELMGYQGRPVQRVAQTELLDHTEFLDNGWNVHVWDRPITERPRIMHATMFPDRLAVMREWARMAEAAA
jgi:hypothetical protein